MMSEYNEWIGRTEEARDELTEGLVARFKATLDAHLWDVPEGAPLGIHWCLAPPAVPPSALGLDGHPRRIDSPDSFLPPVPLPSRMWAGGEVRFHGPLPIGETIVRRSRIAGISSKEGRSGPLVFVAVEHTFHAGGAPLVSERQDVVYKAAPKPGQTMACAPDTAMPAGGMRFGPVTLFRYSALTFNGHRIHYDADYARSEEFYPACVVHGPLQSTVLINRAAAILGRMPSVVSYRGLAPLFVNEPMRVERAGDGDTLQVRGPGGRVTQTARFA